jgi:hypothetical protein
MCIDGYTRAEQTQEDEWSKRDERKLTAEPGDKDYVKPRTCMMTLDADEVRLILERRDIERKKKEQEKQEDDGRIS